MVSVFRPPKPHGERVLATMRPTPYTLNPKLCRWGVRVFALLLCLVRFGMVYGCAMPRRLAPCYRVQGTSRMLFLITSPPAQVSATRLITDNMRLCCFLALPVPCRWVWSSCARACPTQTAFSGPLAVTCCACAGLKSIAQSVERVGPPAPLPGERGPLGSRRSELGN